MQTMLDRYDLIKSHLGITYQDIADELKSTYNAVRMAFKRESLSHLQLQRIQDAFGISAEWLESGHGEMKLRNSSFQESEGIYNAKPISGKMVIQVPFVHQYAYAGYLSGFSDPEYLEDLPVEPVMVDSVPRGNYMAFEVRGDSMDDGTIRSYPARCKVVGREIQKHHWRDKLHIHKWNFIIVHRTDGILLKQIKNHNVNTGVLTLHSFNELYEDFEINLDDVIQIFNVVKKTMEES